MSAPDIHSLRPFVPAKDLALSLRFYAALGFAAHEFPDGSGAILTFGDSSFILQRFFVEEHAHNFMMQLLVPDLDRWWQYIEAAKLPEAFGVPAPTPPAIQPWGLRVGYDVDPTGVLWHVVPVH
jgi:hypothetical protein